MFKKAWEKISNAEIITIFGHVVPDGDCYGSIVGLKNLILENFPDKKVYALGTGLPKYFSLIGEMDSCSDEDVSNSLAIICDTPNLIRVEDQRVMKAKDMIKIDHHLFVEHFGDPEIINNKCISCSEIIVEMIDSLGLPFSENVALPLFLGMVTDSGRFLFQPIRSRTYQLVGILHTKPMKIKELYDLLYEVDERILRFKGYIFSNYKKTKNGALYLTIPKEVIHKYGLDYNTCASLVNSISGIPESPMWAFFSESDSGQVRVELRSKGIPCQNIAIKYGGGGHVQASGCKLDVLEDHILIVNDMDKALKEYNSSCTKKN